jgi:hypothetical protein
MRLALVLFALALAGCPTSGYPHRGYQDVTKYSPKPSEAKATPGGVRYWAPKGVDVRSEVDRLIGELEKCLGVTIRRDWIGVLIPDDAYVSACSGQWLVPSVPWCRLCIDQKGLPLPEKCCGLRKPTKACPCVCNMRSVVQSNWLIVTTKTLALFKAELTRLVTGINFPWGDERTKKCVKQ